jgi:hypothetical protein
MKSWRAYAFVTLLLLAAGRPALAQSEPIKLGQLDPQYLSAAPFAADSAAAAVVLCDFGKTTIVSEGADRSQLRFDRTTRIKILKKSGFDWARVEVLLRHEHPGYTERIIELKGFTYNLVNHQVVQQPLTAEGVFTEKVSAFHSLHKFALPNVREGSVIEFSYSILSDYLLNFRGWQFQSSIPVRWSEYRAAIPHRFTYKMFLQSKQALAADEKTDQHGMLPRYRWAMRDVPALQPEPYMTTTDDYVDELTFELADYSGRDITRSWEQIDEFILTNPEIGGQLDQYNFLKPDLARLPVPTLSNDRQRIAAVRALVCAAVKCTGGPGLQSSPSLRKTYLETHQGTTTDVNLLLIMALRGAGFPANPVLLSTRSHGQARPTYPLLNQFNYVAAHVQLPAGQELVLDASDPQLPYDMLPEHCLNQQGRLVLARPLSSRWVGLRPRYRHTHLQQVQLRLAADGALSGQAHEEYAGYAGASARAELQQLGDQKFSARLSRQRAGRNVAALTIADRDSVLKPLAVDYTFTVPAESKTPLDLIYLSPLRDFGITHNPFRADSRTFPVDFGMAQEETLLVTLTLPAGYELAELPKSKAVELPDNGGSFLCSVTATGPMVQLTSRVLLRKPVYTPAEYGQLRELYRLLLAKQAEKLVVRKKA